MSEYTKKYDEEAVPLQPPKQSKAGIATSWQGKGAYTWEPELEPWIFYIGMIVTAVLGWFAGFNAFGSASFGRWSTCVAAFFYSIAPLIAIIHFAWASFLPHQGGSSMVDNMRFGVLMTLLPTALAGVLGYTKLAADQSMSSGGVFAWFILVAVVTHSAGFYCLRTYAAIGMEKAMKP